MQPVSAPVAAMLRTAIRAPKVYAWLEVPLITSAEYNTANFSLLGSQIILDKVISCAVTSILEPGSDSLNLVIANQDGSLSPINNESAFGRYFFPGAVDNKLAIYIGFVDSAGNETVYPAGIFVIQSTNQESTKDHNQMTIVGLDQFAMFSGTMYAQFPPVLYGNQASNYYNPNYQLQNPSGDNMTFCCDAVRWMTQTEDAPVYASSYLQFNCYVSTMNSGDVTTGIQLYPTGTPTTLTYTVDYVHGIVTFASALPSGAIVTVDATPLAMAPELMIKHLFCDYGNMDPRFLKIDNSGMMLPLMAIGLEQSVFQVAAQIATATAARGIRWTVFFDELGYINFREFNMDAPPVAVLRDEKDILSFSPEYNSRDLQNVVRATATSINQQPLTVVSYDVTSINVFTQRATYDIPETLTAQVMGMDPGSAVAFMTGLCSGQLFANSQPTIQTDIEVLYNPAYETGDVLTIIEERTGTSKDFYIDQITLTVQGPDVTQQLRVQEFKKSQDFAYGIASYFGSPNPESGSNAGQGQTGLINEVYIAGTEVVHNGNPVTDNTYQPLVATWSPRTTLDLTIGTITPDTEGAQIAIWRWIYVAADAYLVNEDGSYSLCTGNGFSSVYPDNPEGPIAAQIADLTGGYYSQAGVDRYGNSTLPYDYRANYDTQNSRRFFWPLIRCSDWLSGDSADGTLLTGGTYESSWSGGLVVGGSAAAIQLYGNLRVGLSDYFGNTTAGYSGVAIFASGTPGATALGNTSDSKYGMDFGEPITPSGSMFYAINNKVTPAFLCILAASTAGAFQFKRIPFSITN